MDKGELLLKTHEQCFISETNYWVNCRRKSAN